MYRHPFANPTLMVGNGYDRAYRDSGYDHDENQTNHTPTSSYNYEYSVPTHPYANLHSFPPSMSVDSLRITEYSSIPPTPPPKPQHLLDRYRNAQLQSQFRATAADNLYNRPPSIRNRPSRPASAPGGGSLWKSWRHFIRRIRRRSRQSIIQIRSMFEVSRDPSLAY